MFSRPVKLSKPSRLSKFSHIALWLTLFGLVPALTFGQAAAPAAGAPAAGQPASTAQIHGHVQDPETVPIANAIIQLSHDGVTALYTFKADGNGDYTGSGITPGTYVVTMFQMPGKALDRFTSVVMTAGQNTLQDFDLSRPDYIASLPPDERQAIEAAKTKNAEIIKENQGVKHLNSMIAEARADDKNKKFDDAANVMQQAVQIKGDVPVLWFELGNAQLGQKKYPDAIASYNKAIQIDSTAKKPDPQIEAASNSSLGEAYADTNKIPESTAAYEAAVKLEPANAAMYYTNEAIVLSRTSQTDATVAAADKAIAADPNKPIPYYLKGQALISKATVDPKTQQITAPPGTAESYQKYLQLDPNGPFASTAQAILAEINQKVSNKYSAPKSKKH